ncbi:hypothetical protein ACN8ZM_32430 [Burkholderia aenigmatica]
MIVEKNADGREAGWFEMEIGVFWQEKHHFDCIFLGIFAGIENLQMA